MKTAASHVVAEPSPPVQAVTLPMSALATHARRLGAEEFVSEGYVLRQRLKALPGPTLSAVADIWQPKRLKGTQVAAEHGLPFLAATQVFDIRPVPHKWLAASRTPELKRRYLEPGWVLVTCSGSVGDAIIAHRPHKGMLVSHDLLRVVLKNGAQRGYIYTYLRTRYARSILRSVKYGNIIKHIEPEHIHDTPVPMVGGEALRATLAENIERAFALRDEASVLVDNAEAAFSDAAGLGHLSAIQDLEAGFSINATELFGASRRLEAASHSPASLAALRALEATGKRLDLVQDLTERVFGVPRFKHIYTSTGIPYLDREDLFKVNPELTKYIPAAARKNAEEYFVKAGWLLMACSGQTYGLNGSVAPATKWHEGKIVSNHVVRIVAKNTIRHGYLLVALSHPRLGRPLVLRHAFGAEVPEVSPQDIRSVPVIRLGGQEDVIADSVERASALRKEADELENEAVELLEAALARALGDISEDDYDAAVASQGLRELARNPHSVLRGRRLEEKLKRWQS
jgi:type I restriction enzyme S subunit